MAKRVFFSFHYERDNWRVSQVRNIGAVAGQPVLSGNEWEAVKKRGDAAIQEWIDNGMKYRPCTVVLIGAKTAGRKWVNYEIDKTWKSGKGLFGIYIHGLKDRSGKVDRKGANPFRSITIGNNWLNRRTLDSVVEAYDPASWFGENSSSDLYNRIKDNIDDWVETAIAQRKMWG